MVNTLVSINFSAHLARQLDFLLASSVAYDAGHRDEAYRIAVAVRVLIHNTKNSTSLLQHLNAISAPLLSTTEPATAKTIFYDGLSLISISSADGVVVQPALGRMQTARFIAAEDWWTEEIYVINQTRLSRKSIALSAANQDGGAHVDHRLDSAYAEFKQGIWSTSQPPTFKTDIPEPQLVFLRQMAYELINSPALNDLVAKGSVSSKNSVITPPRSPWVPTEVRQEDLNAMSVAEVNRLRKNVKKGHFSFLDGLYKSSLGSATNPLGNYQIDQNAGYVGLIEEWVKVLTDENLIEPALGLLDLFTVTARGRAFIARVIEIGH